MDMNKLMQQAQQMQAAMQAAQEKLRDKTVDAESGGGAVKVSFNGKQELLTLSIDPSVVDPEEADMLEDLFNVDLSQRPVFYSEESFRNFKVFLDRFPDSDYAPDARQRMVFLRERLAMFELHVARYYMSRGAWVAAVNRARGVIERYDGTSAVPDSLEVMVTAYGRLGLDDMAADAQALWTASFPEFEGDSENR